MTKGTANKLEVANKISIQRTDSKGSSITQRNIPQVTLLLPAKNVPTTASGAGKANSTAYSKNRGIVALTRLKPATVDTNNCHSEKGKILAHNKASQTKNIEDESKRADKMDLILLRKRSANLATTNEVNRLETVTTKLMRPVRSSSTPKGSNAMVMTPAKAAVKPVGNA